MKIKFNLTWNVFVAGAAIVLLVSFVAFSGVQYYTGTSEFCGGSCHTMDEQYEAWKNNKHHASKNADGMQAGCIDCHFLPGEKRSIKAQFVGLRHLFAYLSDPNAPLPIRPVIPDGACLQSGCHDKAKFQDTEIKYTEKVRFKHKVHFSEKALDGLQLSCDDCHFKVTAEKHFEVPQDICFLCHLKLDKPILAKATMVEGELQRISFKRTPKIDFNEGASKCSICHTIPTKSLQSQIDKNDPTKKPITHQTLQKSGVPCESCHFELVKGHGEINTGNVVSNGCLTCHNRSKELLAKASDKKLMHDKHVATRKADCFDCHSVIEHKNQPDHYDFVRKDCQLCHADQHKYQLTLLMGAKVVDGVRPTPQLMDKVNTNCMSCHIKKTRHKGQDVRTGSADACVGCHTEEHRKMLGDWKTALEKEIKGAREVKAEAMEALKAAAGVVSEEKLKEAHELIAKGQEILNIVEIGNGVHNKKYSIMLMDEVFGNFEDSIDLLESGG